jgi:hypothetical protein
MNSHLNGRCLDFGVWTEEYYKLSHAAITKVGGTAYVNPECHGN